MSLTNSSFHWEVGFTCSCCRLSAATPSGMSTRKSQGLAIKFQTSCEALQAALEYLRAAGMIAPSFTRIFRCNDALDQDIAKVRLRDGKAVVGFVSGFPCRDHDDCAVNEDLARACFLGDLAGACEVEAEK